MRSPLAPPRRPDPNAAPWTAAESQALRQRIEVIRNDRGEPQAVRLLATAGPGSLFETVMIGQNQAPAGYLPLYGHGRNGRASCSMAGRCPPRCSAPSLVTSPGHGF